MDIRTGKLRFVLILACMFIIVVATANAADWQTVFYDDFEDGNLNASVWDTTTACTETAGQLQCTGDNDWQKSVNLTTLGFNSSNPINLTFQIASASNVCQFPSFNYGNPTSNGIADVTGNFGSRTSAANTQVRIVDNWDYNANAGAFTVTYSLIRNSSGYFYYRDGSILVQNTVDSINYAYNYITLGDEAGNVCTNVYVDYIRLQQYAESEAPPTPPADNTTYFQITAKSYYHNVSISEFSANIDGMTFSTTNGTISTNLTTNSTSLYNITVYKTNWFNYTLSNYNVSTNLVASLFQSDLTFRAYDGYNMSALDFNVTIGTFFNQSTSQVVKAYLNASTYTLTAYSVGYYYVTYPLTVTALQNETINLTFYKYANISAVNGKGGAAVSNFTVTLDAQNKDYLQSYSTTNGTVFVPINPDLYNVSIIATGFAPNNTIVNWSAASSVNNLQFTIYTKNSFDITFKDEATLVKINTTTLRLDLISDIYANNYSTSNGTLYVDLLTPTTYTFRYYGTGYSPRLSSFTLTNNTYNVITLYLAAGGQNVTMYVVDEFNQPVESAQILVYRYSTSSNSYVLVNTISTDYEGKAMTDIYLNSEFYRFYIYYDGVLKKSTQPAYVTGTELYFSIKLTEDILPGYFEEQKITYQLSFNPDSNNFRYYYNDPDIEISQGCLRVYSITAAGETLLNESCVSSPSSTILIGVANDTSVYYSAKAYVTKNSEDKLLTVLHWQFYKNSLTGNNGLIFIMLMTAVFIFVGYFSMETAFILAPLPTVFGVVLGWINLPLGAALGVEVLAIALAVLISRRGG